MAGNGKQVTLLDSVSANGAGPVENAYFHRMSFQAVGTFDANIDIEVSNDGTNFSASGLTLTSASPVGVINGPFKAVRANVSGYSSGTITVVAII